MFIGNFDELGSHIDQVLFDRIDMFLNQVRSNEVTVGEWIIFDDTIKAIVLISSSYQEGVFEAHTIFKDIHIVLEGNDTLFLGDHLKAAIKTDYDAKGDYTLYDSIAIASIHLNKNTFVLIPQGEMHTNKLGSASKKVVVKIK